MASTEHRCFGHRSPVPDVINLGDASTRDRCFSHRSFVSEVICLSERALLDIVVLVTDHLSQI